MAKEKSESWVKGYAAAKMLGRTPYPVQIDADKNLDRAEFERGMRFGYTGKDWPAPPWEKLEKERQKKYPYAVIAPHERGNG